MSKLKVQLAACAVIFAGAATAEVPSVAVDIAPLHSLVWRVMEGVGTPQLVVPSGESPHGFNMRPSSAAALQSADLIFWIGRDLSPPLESAIETLADSAVSVQMLDAVGTTLLDFREGALFEAHDHGSRDEHAKDEGHDHDHDDHDHNDHDSHAEHDTGTDDHDGHDHGSRDPHAWLSPNNATVWLTVIATELSKLDPENAGVYFSNAASAREELSTLSAEITALLDSVRGRTFVVFHDAYQYFENSFALPATGAISIADASDPSPARLAEIQSRIREEGVQCVLAEPQFNPALVATVMDGSTAKTGIVDPLGAKLALGPDLYPTLIRDMAEALSECLS